LVSSQYAVARPRNVAGAITTVAALLKRTPGAVLHREPVPRSRGWLG